MQRLSLLSLPFLVAVGCEAGPATPQQPQTRALDLSVTAVDGAGFEREVLLESARQEGDAVIYSAWIDNQPREFEYAHESGATRLTARGEDLQSEVSILQLADRWELSIGGEVVGHFTDENSTLKTGLKSDALSFALLSFMPHEVDGMTPEQMFGEVATKSQNQVGGAIGTIINILKPKVSCKRVKIVKNSCDQACTQSADGCSCGSQCGAIACCQSGCVFEETTEWQYTASAGG